MTKLFGLLSHCLLLLSFYSSKFKVTLWQKFLMECNSNPSEVERLPGVSSITSNCKAGKE
ncbi:MAG: hypothetical protein HXN55_10070 [Prevotella nigrescens]|uniref:Uncharacterized protein n=1 Tax=Prevotella nigrescens TaxID=28133 RepID=A0A9D6AB61_9BACT|nr:hypothetical protein [Prevotella nigrescens]